MQLTTADTPGAVEVTVWDLRMETAPVEPAGPVPDDVVVLEATTPAPDLSEFFYRRVGADHFWVDRLDWDAGAWRAWVGQPGHTLRSLWWRGAPAGYCETVAADDGSVEIAYFGLLPRAQGRGLGRWWLAHNLERLWVDPATTAVWLHTCSLDGAAAKPNYERRGFVEVGVRSEWRSPGPSAF